MRINPSVLSFVLLTHHSSSSYSRGLDGTEFVPGTIGLNNLRATDYMNVIIQALALVSPLRDFFLTDERHEAYASPPNFATEIRYY